jgi:hypothetical protein
MGFTLQNDPPHPPKWRGRETLAERQLVLLEGLDCLPGQQDLFPADNAARTVPKGTEQNAFEESAESS